MMRFENFTLTKFQKYFFKRKDNFFNLFLNEILKTKSYCNHFIAINFNSINYAP